MNRHVKAAIGVSAAWVLLAAAGPARAQSTGQGPLVVQPIGHALVVAPDVKVTQISNRTDALVGGYAGVLYDGQFLIGGAGYWLASNRNDLGMGYGGFLLGWQTRAGRAVQVGVRGLVGGGRATFNETVYFAYPQRFGRFDGMFDRMPVVQALISQMHLNDTDFLNPRRFRFHQGFFVAEPQANAVFRLSRRFHLDAGVGYRAIAAANGAERDLRGVTGSLALRIGG